MCQPFVLHINLGKMMHFKKDKSHCTCCKVGHSQLSRKHHLTFVQFEGSETGNKLLENSVEWTVKVWQWDKILDQTGHALL